MADDGVSKRTAELARSGLAGRREALGPDLGNQRTVIPVGVWTVHTPKTCSQVHPQDVW